MEWKAIVNAMFLNTMWLWIGSAVTFALFDRDYRLALSMGRRPFFMR